MDAKKFAKFQEPFGTPHEAIPFPRFKTEDFLPALDAAIESARVKLKALSGAKDTPTFDNTLAALEQATEPVDFVAEVFFNLLSAEADEAMHAVAKAFSPKAASFSNDIWLDPGLFARVKAVSQATDSASFNAEQKSLLKKMFRNFRRNGADLAPEGQKRIREIDAELARLAPEFSENILKATYAWTLHVENEADLAGLPESARDEGAESAKKAGKPGFLFSLEAPSYIAFMTYADKRELREKMHRAYGSRAFGGEHDNQANARNIAKLRHDRASLLGYATHADYVLEERMATSTVKVQSFLSRLLEVARPAAAKEIEEVKAFAKERDKLEDFRPWDFAYYSEKLKEEKFQFEEETLRPYFRLESVVKGVFDHASRLFGLEFRETSSVPLYHSEVKAYEVWDQNTKAFIGLFYTDFFPRKTKKGGAWMTPLREQGIFGGKLRRPHISIVCNFTKPTDKKPSLLTIDEVRTLYHEFGHALHGLLSECTYRSIAGTNVEWDFVELPSQLMENWVMEKEVLDSFALHYESGEKMPAELAKKIKDSANFQAGYRTVRQLGFSYLDMAWHEKDPSNVKDVEAFESKVMEAFRVLPRVEGTNISCSFSHVFAGGYSAGYYSYKWAEVLEADAFEWFREKGLYDKEISQKLRREILSRGGTEPPMELYRKFRGREPDPDALLRRDGLL